MAERTARRDPFDIWLLVPVLLAAAMLRLADLDRTSFWYDEAVSWTQSSGSFAELIRLVANDNYPPLHNIVLWLTMPVLGDSETALRLPSALFGLGSVFLVYRLGAQLFRPRAGLLAAILLAFSPFHVWYSTEARMYAAFAFFGLLFLCLAATLLRRPGKGLFAATVLAGAAFLYCHIYAVFSFAGAGLVALVLWARELKAAPFESVAKAGGRRLTLAMIASGLLFLPWLVILAVRTSDVVGKGFWIAYPDLAFLKIMAKDMAGSLTVFGLLCALLLVPALGRFLGKSATASFYRRWPVWLLSGFAVAPLMIAYGLSVTVQPILFDRYLIAAWPVFLLLVSAAVVTVSCRLLPLALVAVLGFLLYQPMVFTLFHKVRPDWRQVANVYLKERETKEKILLFKGFSAPALRYYVRDKDAVITAASLEDTAKAPPGGFWLLYAHSSRAEMEKVTATAVSSHVQTGEWRAFGWGESGLTLRRFAPK